ncbi:uncharacterized protein LOC100843907 [Brachypodium distachyon]|uniref:DUF7953 domain-containing protein n=1 Tax=Brachypodium distachyon TaxID=15368 RepID=I1H6S0_BRADI|nr:uncharacterized protein LOC100843907 [Brachypodium distachyon]KQK22244.1 hypothetical protein BRADI_1g66050v3 [Brachypodium distachyon]PNT77618.1 hypothetical protein BRADI_1g66050v3 [Brachypodium distachyon]|eukprot:XP_003558197.1 uncharacterized protein LOC100843907 [Brachypodium distachyon]
MRWPPPISPRRLLLVVLFVALCSIPGTLSSRLVTLDTIDIFTTHEWFHSKPSVYFRCSGDNKTHLPDVKEADSIYTFKGEESWQPLTELPENKCKRCGMYEEDTLLHDDVFDEWELCSSDFKDGKYTHFKQGQFNATFLCPNCTAPTGAATHGSSSEVESKKTSVVVIIIVSVLVSVIVILALFGGYKYWLRKKRERDQLRFLKLFEEGDDMDDELGLSNEF